MSPRAAPPAALDGGVLEPIAICGMACRLPGGINSESSFWQMLVEKRTGQTPRVPESRFNIDAHFHENLDRPGSFNVAGGYFLDGRPEDFDPTFFNITPVEAQWLDPQQRRMLEVSYECITSAGRTLDDVSGSNTAVFVGSFTSDYQQLSTRETDFRHNYAATGVDTGIISNRISNTFNINGPSFTINTACSSSVYALHNACHALRARDCDAAIVGGVNLIITVDQHMNTAKLGILSPTSTCHTFDESADGYGRAEGAGALYIKRLSDAIRCGDPIRGVVRATAVNTNGKVPGMGITHPSVVGQERVVRMAYQKAALDPNMTAYAELHGTGTPVGDPIEVRAISNAMNDSRTRQKPLLVGAVKPNIGHSEAASGIFAVMKAALMTEAAVIPGVALLSKVNPAILESEWNVKVNRDTLPWPKESSVRRASVSSFGYGGTNGHVVVEAIETLYPSYQHARPKKDAPYDHSTERAVLLCLSAHDKPTLGRLTSDIATLSSDYYAIDLAHTLNNHRTAFSQRAFTVLHTGREEAAFDASALQAGSVLSTTPTGVAFFFTGQGASLFSLKLEQRKQANTLQSQWAGMGRVAMAEFPFFADVIRSLDLVLAKLDLDGSFRLEELLVSDPEDTASLFTDTAIVQPLCTAIQIALVDLFSQWDIEPIVSIGHSSGEVAAAYSAGLISAPEAIATAYCRGKAVQLHSGTGSMLAVGLGADEVQSFLPDDPMAACIACENSPESVTISGRCETITQLKESLSASGTFARELKTGRAYHSPHMDDVAAVYKAQLSASLALLDPGDFRWRRNRSEMVSSVTGKRLLGTLPEDYFCLNLRQRVRFDAAVQELGKDEAFASVNVAVEIGPHSALSGPFKQICKAAHLDKFAYIPSLVRGKNDADQLLSVAGSLFLASYPVNLEEVNAAAYDGRERSAIRKPRTQYLLVDLPPYPWNYDKTHWYEPRASAEQRGRVYPRHDLLGSRVSGLSTGNRAWRNILRARDVPWLLDHSLGGSAIFPAAGYLAMAIEAARQVYETEELGPEDAPRHVTLRDVDIKTALNIPNSEDGGVETLLTLRSTAVSGWHAFLIESCSDGGTWTTHCDGRVKVDATRSDLSVRQQRSPVNEKLLTQRMKAKHWYDAFRRVGFQYGRAFQQMKHVQTTRNIHQAVGDVMVHERSSLIQGESRAVIHPVTIDACLQVVIVAIHAGQHREMPWGVVPTQIEEVSMAFPDANDSTPTIGHARAWSEAVGDRRFNTNVQLVGGSAKRLLDIKNLICTAYEAALPVSATDAPPPAPFSTSIWKPDISEIEASQSAAVLSSATNSLHKLVELVVHRQPIREILMLGSPTPSNVQNVLSQAPGTAVVTLGYYEGNAPSFEEEIATRITLLLLPADPGAWDPALQGVFDVLVVTDSSSEEYMPFVCDDGWILGRVDDEHPAPTPSLVGEHYALQKCVALKMPAQSLHIQLLSFPSSMESSEYLAAALETMGVHISRVVLSNYKPAAESIVVIDDTNGQFYSCLNSTSFKALKEIFNASISVLWLTKGVHSGHSMVGGMASGFLRVVCSELATTRVALLDYNESEDINLVASAISKLIARISTKSSSRDSEFWLDNGVLHVSRLIPDAFLNHGINSEFEVAEPQVGCVPLTESMKIRMIDGTAILEPMAQEAGLAPNEVEIQLSSAEQRSTSSSPVLAVGTVIKAGNALSPNLVGKHVAGQVSGQLMTIVHTDVFATIENESTLSQINDQNLLKALRVFSKLIYLLLEKVRMQRGDTLLALPGPHATVTVLAQLSKARGWNLAIAVASNDHKARYESSHLFDGIRILNGEDAHALTAYLESHAGPCRGTNVLAHSFTDLSREIWRHIPKSGNFMLVDSDLGSLVPDATPFARGACFITAPRSSELLSTDLARCLLEIQQTPEIACPDSISEEYSASDSQVGLRTIDLRSAETQFKILPPRNSCRLSADGAYLLVGCLGGLGRSLTKRMLELGARNFAFVSRSGADKPEAALVIEILQEAGASIEVFRADVSDEVAIKDVVRTVSAKHTIRGVVHAAMVLKDGLFEQMDFDSFEAAIAPKARGAITLHNALQDVPNLNLDFFVLTSSISALLGNTGQSSYSAANGVLESLTRFRAARGLPASCLALPMVLDVGVVAETDGLEDVLARKGLYGIDEEEMLRGFEVAMLHPRGATISMGMEAPRVAAAIASAPADGLDLYWRSDPRFCHVLAAMEAMCAQQGGAKRGSVESFAEVLGEAAKEGGYSAAVRVAAAHIAKRVSTILMIGADDMELDGPSIASYGLDSMIGSEMRTWLFKTFGLDYPFQQLLAPTLSFAKLAVIVMESMGISAPALSDC